MAKVTKLQDGIVKWRKRGYSYSELCEKFGTSQGYIARILGRNGMSTRRPRVKKIGKNIGTPEPTQSRIPAGLNGLTRVWASAEKLIDRAKRIKAAVKELHKALHA